MRIASGDGGDGRRRSGRLRPRRPKVNARTEMTQSDAAYKTCLAQHPGNVSACEGARLAYEADLQVYRATSAGIQPGRSDTVNVITGR